MAPSNRVLPDEFNPLLADDHRPLHDILVERRRLGQTDLSSKPGYTGSHAKDPAGVFDYAHLRVPLPKDLRGSGIFTVQKDNTFPVSYFLMRRSKDGFISATGMFKAAFPWSSNEQEAAERSHHKQLPSAGPEEVAGNVWISPADALGLADEYQMRPWILALLDPEPISIMQKGGAKSDIHPPPVYQLEADADAMLPPPSSRRRELRSSSPVKQSARKMATPRKPRKTKQPSMDPDSAPNSSAAPQENGTRTEADKDAAEGTPDKSATPASAKKQDKVTITIDQEGEGEEAHTKVKVEMPANSPDLPLPHDAEEMIRVAKEMVEKATQETGGARTSSKRKVDDLETDPEAEIEAIDETAPGPLAKRQKVQLLETLKKERVRSRTALGLVATLAIGAALTSFL